MPRQNPGSKSEIEMVIYEVTAAVEIELAEAYELFMSEQHIPDLLKTGCFTSVSFERSTPGRYRIRYAAPTRESLDRYLSEHAPRLRKDFIDQFPEGADLSREEWTLIKSFA
jgi:hypothetical protein